VVVTHLGGARYAAKSDKPGSGSSASSSDANLFVPFFTTKPEGSGIGLVLSRAIAESHGGSVDLLGRADGPGCVARIIPPLDAEASAKRATTRTSLPRAPRPRQA
jgi:hypothetical protein